MAVARQGGEHLLLDRCRAQQCSFPRHQPLTPHLFRLLSQVGLVSPRHETFEAFQMGLTQLNNPCWASYSLKIPLDFSVCQQTWLYLILKLKLQRVLCSR